MRRSLLALAATVLVIAPDLADAQPRGRGSRDDAIRICSRELSSRFGGAPVRVEQVHRVSRRGDRLSVYARMRVDRRGNDVRRDVDCAVEFGGRRARVVAFSTDRDSWGGGWGSGGGGDSDQRAARICWREAEASGWPIRSVLAIQPAQGGGRVVLLRSGVNNEVQCLYRNGVRDLRYRRR